MDRVELTKRIADAVSVAQLVRGPGVYLTEVAHDKHCPILLDEDECTCDEVEITVERFED